VALAKMQLAKAAGFDTIRITAIWEPGQSAVRPISFKRSSRSQPQATSWHSRRRHGVMNFEAGRRPDATSRSQFARFAADMVKRVRHPESRGERANRTATGSRSSGRTARMPPRPVRAAARRDLRRHEAADKGVFIIGGSVSPAGTTARHRP